MTKLKKPRIINLPITETCDAQCVMCNVWTAGKTDEFTPEIIRKIFSQELYSKVRHIGLSGGEPTLNENLLGISYTLLEVIPNLKTLSMTSHGFHTDKHQELLPKLKEACVKKNVSFSLNLSLDGIERVHTKVRRIPNAFEKVMNTAGIAKKLGIHVQFQCTISPINLFNIVKVREYATQNGFEVIFRIATYIARLSNGGLSERIRLNDQNRSFIADFLDSEKTIFAANSLGRRLFYKDLSNRLRTNTLRKAPCAFQTNALFLSPNQSVYNCSRSEQELVIEDKNQMGGSINSRQNQKILTDLIKNTCSTCYHDQSGRWPLWRYFTVHNKFFPYFKLLIKLTKTFNIAKNIFLPIPTVKKSPDKTISNFLVIGCYGGEHVGDAAILGGVVKRLNEKYNASSFEVVSFRKDRTKGWVDNLIFSDIDITVIDKSEFSSGRQYDGLVLAGGPLMDIPTLLSNHMDIIRSFKRHSKPFIIEGVGLGPFKTSLSRLLAKKILRSAENISFRTNDDFQLGEKMGINSVKTNDPAFDYIDYARTYKQSHKSLNEIINTNKAIWIINIRPLWKKYSSNGIDIKEIENNVLDSFMKTILSYKNKRFVFMPMNADQYGFSDFEMAYKLEQKLKKYKEVDFKIWEYEPSINNCNFLLEKAELAISMRFHGCIFSLSNKIPTIGIDYSTSGNGKVNSLFKDLGLCNQVIKLKDVTSESLTKKINQTISR